MYHVSNMYKKSPENLMTKMCQSTLNYTYSISLTLSLYTSQSLSLYISQEHNQNNNNNIYDMISMWTIG